MAADHLEQLSEEMWGYLKRDLNEKRCDHSSVRSQVENIKSL